MQIDVGLCRGRHDIPVTDYIFDEIKDVTNYGAMNEIVRDYLIPLIYDAEGEEIELNVYVTGLTAAMLSVVHVVTMLHKRCHRITLNALNYNRATGSYDKQPVI